MGGADGRRTGTGRRPAAEAEALEARLRALLAGKDVKGAATLAIREYGPEVLRYLRGLLGNETDAREAFSAAAEKLWRFLPEFRGDSAVRTWCFRLAWTAAADLRKEAWRARGRRLETGEGDGIADREGTRSWLRRERLALSLEALREALTLEEQALLQLRIDQGMTWADCAEVLAVDGDVPKANTVMKRFERVKERLSALARERAGR